MPHPRLRPELTMPGLTNKARGRPDERPAVAGVRCPGRGTRTPRILQPCVPLQCR